MALAPIDDDPVDHAGPTGTPALTPHTAVHVARARLSETREAAAVVFQQGRPAGIVTADALAEPGTTSQQDAPIATVMDYVAVHVTRGTGAHETVRAFTDAAWDWLKLRRSAKRVRRLC
jgi:predicted transcriptional regulator